MLKIDCEIPSAEKATDKEILDRFPKARLILVLDEVGDINPLKLSQTKIAEKTSEIPEKLHVDSLRELSCIGHLRYKGSNGQLLIIGGDYVRIEY